MGSGPSSILYAQLLLGVSSRPPSTAPLALDSSSGILRPKDDWWTCLRHAAKQNHLVVASVLRRGLGESVHQQNVSTSETQVLGPGSRLSLGQFVPRETGSRHSESVCFCQPGLG